MQYPKIICLSKFKYKILLQKMRWRNQNNNANRNNQTLDCFINGLNSTNSESSSRRNSNVIPKIKVPRSSGLQPVVKPLQSPFMYPEYPQFRQYQYSIAIKCVTQNTLVCLPTGLGKTHIASVMMLNFHLWFPDRLIFFLAPTKPLVDQQSMCLSNFRQYVQPGCIYSITGSVLPPKRLKIYESKRIFYCTPQTLENDLRDRRLDPKRIILIIFDEAHKSVGNYAYANIVKILDKENFGYRIIGLSATPGNDHDRIQDVLQNLQISNMIVKSEDDEDVKKYIKNKRIEPVFIQSTTVIKEVEKILQQFISWPINQLLKFRLFDKNLAGGRYGFNPKCFFLINQQVTQRLSSIPIKFVSMIQSAKCFLKFLSDSQSLLRESGYQSFKRKFIYQIDDTDEKEDYMDKMFPQRQKIHENFAKLIREHAGYKRIKQLFIGNMSACSHPKLQKLRNILCEFFSKQQNIRQKSKVIVFANLRFTCHQIHKYLSQHPYGQIIKSEIFLGQSKTTVQTRDGDSSITQTLQLSQKQQINLIKRYKANQINTLISTSIGEQGLDIGQVDAIFCYQGGMSTIRMVQRMGRTGRKRDGVVYILLMDGKQSQDYERATKKTQRMKKTNNKKYKYYSFNPVLFEEFGQIPINFFTKPEEKKQSDENISATESQTPKQANTKRKKNKTDKNNDRKKTKKKICEQQTRIQQATNSQQCDQPQNNNQHSNTPQFDSKDKNQESTHRNSKYFHIVQHQNRVPDWKDSQTSDNNNEQQQHNITSNTYPYQYKGYQNYGDNYYEQYYEGDYSRDQPSFSQLNDQPYKIDTENQKFNELFDIQKMLQGDEEKQIQQNGYINKINQAAVENKQQQKSRQSIQIQNKEYFNRQYTQSRDCQQSEICQLSTIKNKQQPNQIIANQDQAKNPQCEQIDDDFFNQIYEQYAKINERLAKNEIEHAVQQISDHNKINPNQDSDDSSQLIDQHQQKEKQSQDNEFQ